jgi:hypothetical protein
MAEAYAKHEKRFSSPISKALVFNPHFRTWLLAQTKFAAHAAHARLLSDEMFALRTSGAANWWVSHYQLKCDCFGCIGGKETDLLAVFEGKSGFRFALHFEIKRPGDQFISAKQQPAAYKTRAMCWIVKSPTTVLPHHDAATVLICSPLRLRNYGLHAAEFDNVITVEEIAVRFPALLSL